MIRRRLRTAVESAARWSGVLTRFESRARGRLTILTYHRVLPDECCADYPFPSLVMPRTAFEAQVEHLTRRWRVLPVGEALHALEVGGGDARPLVAITFDDGYADNHDVAAPILAAHGARATFFVVSGFVDGSTGLWFDRAVSALRARGDDPAHATVAIEALKGLTPRERDARIDEWIASTSVGQAARGSSATSTLDLRPMTRDDVRALARAGHEIAAHSESHPILTRLTDAELDRELVNGRRELSQWIGADVTGLAYPNGDHDERIVARARAAGYTWACTTESGRNDVGCDRLRLRRIDVTPHRVEDHRGTYSVVAFRSAISLLRDAWRREKGHGPS